MNVFNVAFDGIDAGVEALFSINNIALWFAFALLCWCGWIIVYNARRHYLPFQRQLTLRLAKLSFLDDAPDGATALAEFAAAFPRIDAIMAERGRGAAGLRHGWLQYRETLLDPEAVPIVATARPEEYFLHLGDETRVLAWWANIFVAVGLTFTFLGIVAALLKAVQAMGTSADPANMQVALVGLLHITAAKFWTSIGGVLSSIILRIFDRHWHSTSQRRLEQLCTQLETGIRFVTPQRIAADQLLELRRQGELLASGPRAIPSAPSLSNEGGTTDMADAARRLSEVADRLAAVLDAMDGHFGKIVERASAGLDDALGQAARRSMDAAEVQVGTLETANDQVRHLLGTLEKVLGQAAGVFQPLREATQSIERSVGVTQEMLDMVRKRTEHSDDAMRAIAKDLEKTSDTATRAWQGYQDRFEGVDTALASALERINAASVEHAGLLTEQVGRIDSALAQAVDRLAGALDVMGDLVAVLDDMRGEIRDGR
jgi:hypothetical protein